MKHVVLFDLDDTLVVEQAMAVETFQVVCRRAHDRTGVDADALHQAVRRCARAMWYAAPTADYCKTLGISSWEGLWGRFTSHEALREWAPTYQFESWKRGLMELGIQNDAMAAELSSAFAIERRKRHRPFPDAEPVLRELRGHYSIGLITNGASDLQREKLQGARLDGYFDLILASGDIGVGKPDRKIFEHALRELAVDSGTALMVGDNHERDVQGARNVGIRGLWLNRDQPSGPESIQTLRELLRFL
jgi:putative hydrolase of the HAD superfamily